MRGGIGLGKCSRTRRMSFFRPVVVVVALLAVALATGLAGWSGHSTEPSEAAAGVDNYPRLAINQHLGGAGKYHAIIGRSDWINDIVTLKADLASKGRSILALRYFAPRQYQNDTMSMPYDEIYPGHWLFTAGTTTTAALTITATSVPVASTSSFSGLAGYYAMIWDGTAKNPALTPDDPAFWANAEHVKIIAVGGTIIVQRGYNPSAQNFSSGLARSHANGSRIAVHLPGAFTGPQVWSLNQSTASPRDAQGRQLNQVMATWVGQHLQHLYNKSEGTYRSYPGAWDGFWFDATCYWIDATQAPSDLADVNNDLVADGGILTPGHTAWGEGLDVFFSLARQALGADKTIVGGSMTSRGASYLNGDDLEGFPGSGHSSNNYRVYSTALATYLAWDTGAGYSPPFTDLFTRIGTDEYAACDQYNETTDQGKNSDFRLGLGTALLGQAYFAYTNGCFDGDYWWDEYSVDLSTGAAVPVSAGLNALAAHTGYLGQPLGGPQRLSDPTAGANLMTGGTWRIVTSGGGAATHTVSGTTVTVNITSPGTDAANVTLQYGPVSLVSGQEYTLSFWGKADNGRMGIDLVREVDISVNDGGGKLGGGSLTGSYRQYFIDFVSSTTTSSGQVKFQVGGEEGTVWIDRAGLYQGAADLFRRDFDNGIVITNGTWQSQTVALGANFRKILGTQDPAFNNGATVSSVTLAPHDAIILLRTGPAPTPTRTATPGPTTTPTPVGATDLRVAAMQDPPGSVSAGTTLEAADTTKNFGPSAAGPSTTRFYLSQDTAKGAGDVLLTPGRAVPGLAAGSQSWGTVTVTISGSTPSATYYLLACADDAGVIAESDEGNNCKASNSTMQVSGGSAPDLRVVSMQVPPPSVSAGGTLDVADTTKNTGEGAAPISVTRYYLSQDTAKGSDDVALTPDRAVPALAAGSQSWGAITVTIPGSAPSGTYYLLACADDADLIPEIDEGNNCNQKGPIALSGPPLQGEDSDGDGCTAYEEAFGAPPPMPGSTCTSPAPCYSDSTWYDFYDVPTPANRDPTANGARNGNVDMGDVLAVLLYAFADEGGPPNANGVDYDSLKDGDWNGDAVVDANDRVGLRYDRSPSPAPNPPAEAGPPTGSVDMSDVLAVLTQFGLECEGAP